MRTYGHSNCSQRLHATGAPRLLTRAVVGAGIAALLAIQPSAVRTQAGTRYRIERGNALALSDVAAGGVTVRSDDGTRDRQMKP